MKAILLNLGTLVLIAALYFGGFFDFFAKNGVLWVIMAIVGILFVLAFKIIGNPWTGK